MLKASHYDQVGCLLPIYIASMRLSGLMSSLGSMVIKQPSILNAELLNNKLLINSAFKMESLESVTGL